MAGALAARPVRSSVIPAVAPLYPSDVPALRLPHARANQSLRSALELHPGRSVWIPDTLEYALIGSWRNRSEIASVDELVASRNGEPLLRAVYERCVARGDDLILAIELEASGTSSRYERAGFELLEEVITYEIDVSRVPRRPMRGLRLVRVDALDRHALDLVAALDQAAFPWLWRNSREEFEVYAHSPGVELAWMVSRGVPIAYVGVTMFPGWGHLDRIAVAPEHQGQGFGKAALILAIETMRSQGARRIGLSTQRSNERSQRMYENFGFRRTPGHDYELYGAWCGDNQHSVHPLQGR